MILRKSDYENYDYTKFWKDNKRLYEDRAERLALRKLLTGVERKNILFFDIGCGYGRLFNEYKDFENIVLVDYSIKNLKSARNKIKKFLKDSPEKVNSVHFLAADAVHLPLKSGCANAILTVRVVHHLDEPGKYFNEVARILSANGIYFLEFANKRNLKNILRSLIGKMDTSPFNLVHSHVGETILNFHPKYIIDNLKKRNFTIKKMISVSNFRLNILKRFPGTKALIFFEKIYQILTPFVLLGPSVFLKSIFNEQKYKKRDSKLRITLKDNLICPSCKKQKLFFKKGVIRCRHCGSIFRQKNGIYDFRINT